MRGAATKKLAFFNQPITTHSRSAANSELSCALTANLTGGRRGHDIERAECLRQEAPCIHTPLGDPSSNWPRRRSPITAAAAAGSSFSRTDGGVGLISNGVCNGSQPCRLSLGFTDTKARSPLKGTERRMYSAAVCRFEWLKRASCVHGLRSARWMLATTELLKTRAFEACGCRILARRSWLRACVAAA